MATKHVLDLSTFQGGADKEATGIGIKWQTWKSYRQDWEELKRELRNYLFATDTSTTSNANLPWKNSTTLPKLTQIRDNLHANYMAALFPHDEWFNWLPLDKEAATEKKRKAIINYMMNKLELSNFRETISQLVYDYIDYGNAFAEVVFDREYHTNTEGETIPKSVGPRLQRVSPLDIVFDVTAPTFDGSPTITRTLTTVGNLEKMIKVEGDNEWIPAALEKAKDFRRHLAAGATIDVAKNEGLQFDGFSSLTHYFQSGMVEVLTFEGDLYEPVSGELQENRKIIVIDRQWVVYNQPYKSWLGSKNKKHVGWRLRPDNLMAMGPLDNLVGMQYRMDHLENLRADVFDQIAHPVVYQRGMVEDWEWGPGEKIFGDEESDVRTLSPDTTALQADFQIPQLQNQMEEMAGAPRQAMGIRTPGEKTAFEVQTLENASGRIFQNKVAHFEDVFVEPLLNEYLEVARRNMDVSDTIRVFDDDIGVNEFMNITPEDIKANGRLVPRGARHFARTNQLAQNLIQLTGSPAYADPSVQTHISGLKLAKALEEVTGLERFDLVSPNIRVEENAETQSTLQTAQSQLAGENAVGTTLPDGAVDESQGI